MSNRITKSIAEAVAKQLVQSKQGEITEVKNNLKKFVTEKYIDSLPDGLLSAFKRFKNYVSTTQSIRLIGEGLSQGYKYYHLADNYPTDKGILTLSPSDSETIINFDNDVDKRTLEVNKLRNEIEVALFNLRTYSQVEKEFPEAAKLLPVKENSAIAINIKDIRCKLGKDNC